MIECPRCRTPFTPTNIKTVINYPEDVTAIFDLVEDRFNLHKCEVCSFDIYVFTDMAILYSNQKKVIAFFPSEDDKLKLKQGLGAEYEITFAESVPEAKNLMMKWMYTSMPETIEEMKKREGNHNTVIITPFQLRLMLSALNGFVSVTVSDSNGNTYVPQQNYELIVDRLLLSLWADCVAEENILSFPEKIRQRILPECLTPGVLQNLLTAAGKAGNLAAASTRWEDVVSQFIADFINAVAHLHAGVPNPRLDDLTKVVYWFWRSHLNKPLEGMAVQFLLDKIIGPELLSFGQLFDLGLIIAGRSDDHVQVVDDMYDIMGAYGWGNRLKAAIKERFRMPVDLSQHKKEELVDFFATQLVDNIPFNKGPETYAVLGPVVIDSISVILRSGHPAMAKDVINRLLAFAEDAGDKIACIDICVQSVKAFNRYHDFKSSMEMFQLIHDRYSGPLASLPADRDFDLLIELGNTLRYELKYDAALEIYLQAQKFTREKEVHSSPQQKAEAATVLKRNIAILYRELGKMALSEQYFIDLLDENPKDFEMTISLVVLYLRVNDYKGILSRLARFENTTSLTTVDMVMSLSFQAMANAGLGNQSAAFSLMKKALGNTKTLVGIELVQLMNAGLQVYAGVQGEDATELEQQAFNVLKGQADRKGSVSFNTLAAFLLRRFLLTGNLEGAKELIDCMGWNNGLEYGVWQYQFYLCWYAFEAGDYPAAATYARYLLVRIAENMRIEADAKYAVSWMHDKEELQLQMRKIMYRLYKAGLVNEKELLAIIEFSYGQELSIKLQSDKANLSIDEMLNSEQYASSVVIGFFEADNGVYFFFITAGGEKIIISDDALLSLEEAEQLNVQTKSAFRDACPGLLHLTDKKLQHFRNFLAKLSGVFTARITPGIERVIFMPGKALANLPFHLMPFGAATLAEHLPVIYVSNLVTLVYLKNGDEVQKKTLVVTVTRHGEKQDFVEKALNSSNYIKGLLHSDGEGVLQLSEREATIAAVKERLHGVGEVLFLCHGASGGSAEGRGICLSYKERLPPALLPVEKSPELKNFLLTWKDLDDIEVAPPVVVSIACSSGATVFGKGGTYMGFEQSLFAKGTSAIVSPLWDVDQGAAIYWVEQFYKYRRDNPEHSIDKAYKFASIETKAIFAHEYFWAPFILKGTIN